MQQLGLFFLVLAVTAVTHTVLAVQTYDDLVLTSIDVIDIGKGKVEFSGKIRGEKDDTNAVFLRNVKRVRMEGIVGFRRPIFQADLVPLPEAQKAIRSVHKTEGLARQVLSASLTDGKPLFCVHGFNVQPETHLKQCKEIKGKFTKFKLIPVIWPSRGGLQNYFLDRTDGSVGAGRAFKGLAKLDKFLPKKALMAHSMGNRVLRYAADPSLKFDNIFMVAADVNGEMFHEEYINDTNTDNEEENKRKKDGIALKNMLRTNRGKIYQLHNNQDYALLGSTVTKLGVPRLGTKTLDRSELHPEVRDRIEGKNAGQDWLNWTPNFAAHNYQWDDKAIEFYQSKFYND
mmetsp:Transcript_9919/g.13966  ORF Transcript_9919/g.13966 Transcript_9919/m.13966 type:complete len:344 (+) Transcript_9919:64-1095(+)